MMSKRTNLANLALPFLDVLIPTLKLDRCFAVAALHSRQETTVR